MQNGLTLEKGKWKDGAFCDVCLVSQRLLPSTALDFSNFHMLVSYLGDVIRMQIRIQ